MKNFMSVLLFAFAFGTDRSLLGYDGAMTGRRRLIDEHVLKKTVIAITAVIIGIAVTLGLYYSQTLLSAKYWLDFWELLIPYFQQFCSILESAITMIRVYVPWIFQTTIDWIVYGFYSLIEIPNVLFNLLSKVVSFLTAIGEVLFQILVKIPDALRVLSDSILQLLSSILNVFGQIMDFVWVLIQKIPGAVRIFGDSILQLLSSIVNAFGHIMDFVWVSIQKIPGAIRIFGDSIFQLLSSILNVFTQMMELLWILLQKIPGAIQVSGGLILQLLSSMWMFITYIPQYFANGIAAIINSFFWLSMYIWSGVEWAHQIWLWISGFLVSLWGAFLHNLLYYFGCLTSELARIFTTLFPQFARYIFHHLSYIFAKAIEEPKASFSIAAGFLTALFFLIRFWKS